MSTLMSTLTRTIPTLTIACLGLACVEPGEPIDELEARERMADLDPSELEAIDQTSLPSDVDADTNVCTLEARPAVLVSVMQSFGDYYGPVNGEATVLYRHWDGSEWGEILEAQCIDEDCTRAALGFGVPGIYVLGAFACGDGQLGVVEVGETEDGCHVETVHASFVLDDVDPACRADIDSWASSSAGLGLTPSPGGVDTVQAPCEPRAKSPSVIAMTGVIEGDIAWPRTPDQIVAKHESEEQATSMTCIDDDCSTFVHGWDQAGEFEVSAEICGTWVSQTVEVQATADGCHVDTVWVPMFADGTLCDDEPSLGAVATD